MNHSTFFNQQRTFSSLERDIFFKEYYKTHPSKYRTITKIIDFESYREPLEKAVRDFIEEERVRKNRQRSKNLKGAGRKSFDSVFMFKCCFLQRYLNLSDECFFLAMHKDDELQDFLDIQDVFTDIPSAKSLWRYREIFTKKGVFETVFKSFVKKLKNTKDELGQYVIVDSSFVEVPKQRNSREENKRIKQGKGGDLWNDNKYKKCQKDTDARWTKKRDEVHYGYKAHHTVCAVSKLILNVFTTDASVHDANPFERLLPENLKIKALLADAGYAGNRIAQILKERNICGLICQKGYKNKPLTAEQIKENTEISSWRCRIEHVFGFIENSMHGSTVRSIGFLRAQANVFLTSLVYNVFRVRQILEQKPMKAKTKAKAKAKAEPEAIAEPELFPVI